MFRENEEKVEKVGSEFAKIFGELKISFLFFTTTTPFCAEYARSHKIRQESRNFEKMYFQYSIFFIHYKQNTAKT